MRKVKNRNEDLFGIIKDDNYQFKTLDKARNYLKDLKDKLKRRASAQEFPVTSAVPEDRKKFLLYAISLMTKKNLPFSNERRLRRSRAVLSLMARGHSYYNIATYLKQTLKMNVTIDQVKDAEKEGIKMVQDCITTVQGTKTPIIGG